MNDLYTFSVPVFKKSLGGLKAILQKAEMHAKEKGVDEHALLQDPLYPDMFPLVRQIQMATDNAKGASARLAGIDIPKYEDTETSFAELIARIDKTLAFLDLLSPGQFADAADRKVTLSYFPGSYMTGADYFKEYGLPNFFFHYCMAYALIRKNGVAIGKGDYIHGMPLRDLPA